MLKGKDVDEVVELKQQGLSIRAIRRMTGCDRKTINKYLAEPSSHPVYGPRAPAPSKWEPFKASRSYCSIPGLSVVSKWRPDSSRLLPAAALCIVQVS